MDAGMTSFAIESSPDAISQVFSALNGSSFWIVATFMQVRKSVYQSGVGIWQNYGLKKRQRKKKS
jgi:hypothetical protein